MTRIIEQGDTAMTVSIGERRDAVVARRVLTLARRLDHLGIEGVVEVVPALVSVTCLLNPDRVDRWFLRETIERLLREPDSAEETDSGRLVEIPICYEPEAGTDLEVIARDAGETVEQIIALHMSAEYRVAMIGFLPGFPYLEGMPLDLARPRRSTPRRWIDARSVAIGGEFCGIYPFDSPGGWWVIGRTPLTLFDPLAPSPSLLSVGDRVRFRRVWSGSSSFEPVRGVHSS